MREILTRYGRHNIGFMWLFFEPMLFTLGITLLWSMVKVEHVANVPITPFALTGYSSVLVWRNAVNRCNLAIEPNLSLLFHRNVRVLDIFFRTHSAGNRRRDNFFYRPRLGFHFNWPCQAA